MVDHSTPDPTSPSSASEPTGCEFVVSIPTGERCGRLALHSRPVLGKPMALCLAHAEKYDHDFASTQIALVPPSSASGVSDTALWVDDSKPCPAGCAVARNYDDAIHMLRTFQYGMLYLDHDLGEQRTGYDLLQQLVTEGRVPPRVKCISWNPVGRKRIEDLIQDIEAGHASPSSASTEPSEPDASEVMQRRCLFCGKHRDAVRLMIQAPTGHLICNECVADSVEIIAEKAAAPSDVRAPEPVMPGAPCSAPDDEGPFGLCSACGGVHERSNAADVRAPDAKPVDKSGEDASAYSATASVRSAPPEARAPEGTEAPTTIRDLQRINQARSDRWMAGSPGWTKLEIAGELAGECGELANVCKKLRRSELGVPGNKLSDAELIEQARGELGDVFIVTMLVASKLGIDLYDATREAFNKKSEQMGFPERFPEN